MLTTPPATPDDTEKRGNDSGNNRNDPAMKRLRRLMAPRTNGKYIVPDELVQQWADEINGGRDALVEEWRKSGNDKDLGWRGLGFVRLQD